VWDLHEGRWSKWPYPERKGHLSTGFLGVNHLQFALSEHGRAEEAFALLLREDFPSWLFPVRNGATTIWERWDGWTPDGGFQDPEMNSFNHYAYGAIGQWCYEILAGLRTAEDPDGVGYRRLILAPHWPDGAAQAALGHARAELRTPYGRATSGWEAADEGVIYTCSIPGNAHAELRLPVADPATVVEAGLPLDRVPGITDVAPTGDALRARLAAGDYRFTVGADRRPTETRAAPASSA